MSASALTAKDKRDIITAAKADADYVAISFPVNADDVRETKRLLAEAGSNASVIAKIERAESLQDDVITEIIQESAGIMVARGDLGVEIGDPQLPAQQKRLIQLARANDRFVITATQMLESMIVSPIPTRAEVFDVANAVLDGTDAVMLSAETSVGKFPVEVIKSMSSILMSVEGSKLIKVPNLPPSIKTKRYITKSICYHASIMANEIGAKAICTLTNSGYTAFQISAWRPKSNILVFTSNKRILSQLNLLWGVKSFFYDSYESTDKTVEQINEIAQKFNYVSKGDFLINLTAMPVKSKGMVNTLRVSEV